MHKLIVRTVSALALVSLFAGSALAAPPKEAPKCPACGMTLATKKSDKTPVAIKLTKKGKTLYCCAGCKDDMVKKDIIIVPDKKKK